MILKQREHCLGGGKGPAGEEGEGVKENKGAKDNTIYIYMEMP